MSLSGPDVWLPVLGGLAHKALTSSQGFSGRACAQDPAASRLFGRLLFLS